MIADLPKKPRSSLLSEWALVGSWYSSLGLGQARLGAHTRAHSHSRVLDYTHATTRPCTREYSLCAREYFASRARARVKLPVSCTVRSAEYRDCSCEAAIMSSSMKLSRVAAIALVAPYGCILLYGAIFYADDLNNITSHDQDAVICLAAMGSGRRTTRCTRVHQTLFLAQIEGAGSRDYQYPRLSKQKQILAISMKYWWTLK